jgi:hypothetical protein
VENQVLAIGCQEEVTTDLFSPCRDEGDTVLEFSGFIRIGNVIDVEACILGRGDVKRFAIRRQLHIGVVRSFPTGGEFDFLDALFGGDHDFCRGTSPLSHAPTTDSWR